jgi:hypothetical protein
VHARSALPDKLLNRRSAQEGKPWLVASFHEPNRPQRFEDLADRADFPSRLLRGEGRGEGPFQAKSLRAISRLLRFLTNSVLYGLLSPALSSQEERESASRRLVVWTSIRVLNLPMHCRISNAAKSSDSNA